MYNPADPFTRLVEAIEACADYTLRSQARGLLDDLQCDEHRDLSISREDELVGRFISYADNYEGMFAAIVRVAFPK